MTTTMGVVPKKNLYTGPYFLDHLQAVVQRCSASILSENDVQHQTSF